MRPQSLSRGMLALWVIGSVLGAASWAEAQLVPGTGNLLNYDDLEDANWGYVHNFPKSSKEEDENIRYPLGGSNNRMWSESPKRGSPDVIKRCETPAGGLAGSTGALYMRTRDSGIPGHPMNKQAQDDFILTARPCGVGYSPNYVVRVFLPEFQDWEQRQGVSFGIRAGMQGPMTKQKELSLGRRFLRGGKKTETVTETEPYYPGFFIAFNPMSANNKEPYAQVLIRSDHLGNEVPGPKITRTGWWTFGMSVTPDARCHYYAHPGISDLTAKDHIYSSLPYNIRGEYFNTIFFNVCSADNGSSWSTPWIIDDPKVYYSGPPVFKQPAPQQAQQPQPVKTAEAPAAAPNAQNASMTKEIPAAPAAATPPQAAPAQTPAAATAPMAPAAQTAAPPMLQQVPAATPMTSLKPAAVQVPVVGIPAVPAPAVEEVVTSAPASAPIASATLSPVATENLTAMPSNPVPVTAPPAASLQQPAPISSSPAVPVQPIATLGVPVKAPSMQALSTPPAEFSGPVTAAIAHSPIVTIQPIAPIPAPATFTPPVTAAPVSTTKAIPIRTATATTSKAGIPVRPASVPVSIEKPATPELPAPAAPVAPVASAPAPVAKPLTSTLAPIPPVEPESLETPEAPVLATAAPQDPPPALLIPTLPKEEIVPAKQMQQAPAAPLMVPALPSENTEAAVPAVPAVPQEKAPVAPAIETAPPAANPFDDSRKATTPKTAANDSSEEPPLTVLEPAVDTSKADPAPVPTPPAVE